MKIFNSYISRGVIGSSLITVLVLLILLNLVTFTDELGDLGDGNYGLLEIFQYLALTTPRNFFELMPSAVLIGSLFSLGGMATHHELVAMRAAGVSLNRIIWAMLRAGLVIVIISMLIGEFVAPRAERTAQVLKASAQNKQVALRTRYGFWVRDGNTFINIREIQERDKLGNLYIYELDGFSQMRVVTRAESAEYEDDDWRLGNMEQSEIRADEVIARHADHAVWTSIIDPGLLNAAVVKPENLGVIDLAHYISFLRENGQKSEQFELAFWGRIANPAVTLVMILLAAPFVLTVGRTVSVGQRIVLGVIMGIGFYLFNQMAGHIGLVWNLNPLVTAMFPPLTAMLVGVVWIRRLY